MLERKAVSDSQKGYTKPYATDPRRIFRIGMNFSSETRTIAEWKVQ